jgi:hypothetical protein
MDDQSQIKCVKLVENFFITNWQKWVTIPQIGKACRLQDNTVHKAIYWIRKQGSEIKKGPRIYNGDRYYHKYTMSIWHVGDHYLKLKEWTK